jgi:hypothetical protein
MRGRKLITMLGAGTLLVGLGLGLAVHAADVRGEGKGEGKVGDLCKTTADCSQSPTPLTCREANGESRCSAPIIRPPT